MPHFNALARGDPCEYRRKWYIAKNYILWPAFLPQKVWVYLQPLLRNLPRNLSTEFGEITQRLGPLSRSRSFTVTEFGTNRKLICDFLLVIIEPNCVDLVEYCKKATSIHVFLSRKKENKERICRLLIMFSCAHYKLLFIKLRDLRHSPEQHQLRWVFWLNRK